jgi:hypothetical protein
MPTPKIPLRDGSDYQLPWKLRLELGEIYFDVDEQIELARLWCLANPSRRKINGFRFIVNWLARSGKRRPVGTPQSLVRVAAADERTDQEKELGRLKAMEAVENMKRMLKRG